MPQPLVSVIIPTYNRSAFLRSALDSVLRQTLDELELIVIDDGSRDDTPALLDSLADRRVEVTTHTLNRGIAEARNSGLLAARGKYVAWLDSDDVAGPIGLPGKSTTSKPVPKSLWSAGVPARSIGTATAAAESGCRLSIPTTSDAGLLFKSAFQQSSVMGRAAILKDTPYDRSFPERGYRRACQDCATPPPREFAAHPGGPSDPREPESPASAAARYAGPGRISAPQLAAMGVEFSEEDLLSHAALARSPRPPNGIVDRGSGRRNGCRG